MAITDDDIRAVQMEAAQLDREAAKLRLYAAEAEADFASGRVLERMKAEYSRAHSSVSIPPGMFPYPVPGTPIASRQATPDAEDPAKADRT